MLYDIGLKLTHISQSGVRETFTPVWLNNSLALTQPVDSG